MDRMLAMTTFVKVVNSGGFSAAARALNMSASAVTTHVQAIEDRLGVRLLPEQPADLENHNCLLYADSPWRKEWEFIDADGNDLLVPISGT